MFFILYISKNFQIMESKIRYELEFPINSSPQLLYQYISTPSGFRINLLCNDLEFETLIKRWKESMQQTNTPNIQDHELLSLL